MKKKEIMPSAYKENKSYKEEKLIYIKKDLVLMLAIKKS